MKVTLKDISEATNFSVSTISRAIRGEGRISEKNRRKILACAHKLGYPLPTNGRKLPKDQPPNIALITQLHPGEFYASFFNGFVEAATTKKVTVSLFSVTHDIDSVSSLIEKLRNLGYAAAVIFVPELKEEQYLHILHATPKDFPVISCSNIDNSVLDTVTFDAYQGASLVAKHLFEQGFRKLGIIEGPHEMPEARFRTNGFMDFIKRKDDANLLWDFKGDYTLQAGIRAFHAFHQLDEKPDAVFAANDAMAFGFMEAAREAGYTFPDDVALVGYDNLPMCENHYPRLTSVETNYTRLAENTIDNLLSRLKKPIEHQGIVSMVPVSLKVRQSSTLVKDKELA
ncbi:LacI family DNA-binding transcriptional regulator [Gracilimonas mengyeensis]|uniref:Transcriptional regulator, LacI family n=1 Tax=Gracilimonas mengyeensis TaxID=1302730 RepID=A0A521B665_9BACT|nr:LacI family DNA-binding transcriptional regulator [Gracilimonas mengyeensis]SMO42597.1 transcriptional regulator, LacI family [Gracilimonas mengyeensis]